MNQKNAQYNMNHCGFSLEVVYFVDWFIKCRTDNILLKIL